MLPNIPVQGNKIKQIRKHFNYTFKDENIERILKLEFGPITAYLIYNL